MKLLIAAVALFVLAACEKHIASAQSTSSAHVLGSEEFPYVEACGNETPDVILTVSALRTLAADPIEVEVKLKRVASFKPESMEKPPSLPGVRIAITAREKKDGAMLYDDSVTLLIPFFEDCDRPEGHFTYHAHWNRMDNPRPKAAL